MKEKKKPDANILDKMQDVLPLLCLYLYAYQCLDFYNNYKVIFPAFCRHILSTLASDAISEEDIMRTFFFFFGEEA